MTARTAHSAEERALLEPAGSATRNGGISTAAAVGVPGIDSRVNWTDQFSSQGYDGNGNPQSVWPYAMVGLPPESGATTRFLAPVVPVTIDLLGPTGTVAYSFGPTRGIIKAALNSPEFKPNTYTNGAGQLNDQIMRAAFANRIGEKSSWHNILQPVQRTARRMEIPYLTPGNTPGWAVFLNSAGQTVLAASTTICLAIYCSRPLIRSPTAPR